MKKNGQLTKIALVVTVLVLIGMLVQLLPIIEDIFGHADENSIVEQIDSIGWRGVPALISLAALQVIIPFIPAPIVGIVSGLRYGVFGGGGIFLLGFALGNLFVMVFVRELRSAFIKRKKVTKISESALRERVNRIKRPEIVAMFLTLIPFVSSFGPYLFTETNVALKKYIPAVIIGNIPSTFLYVYLGRHISDGNLTTVIIVAILAIAAIICALIFRRQIMDKIFESGEQ